MKKKKDCERCIPDYLVIGHVTWDLLDSGSGKEFGGTSLYAACTALQFGYQSAIVTSAEETSIEELRKRFPDVWVHNRPSTTTTTFENRYNEIGQRTQFLRAQAEKVTLGDVPIAWRATPIVHFGPVAQDFDPVLLTQFSEHRVFRALTPQGFLRIWDAQGKVSPTSWENAEHFLRHIQVVILSYQDVGIGNKGEKGAQVLRKFASATRVISTLSSFGSLVHEQDWMAHHKPRKAEVVDPTGAGDVFAAAYIIKYFETRDGSLASRFANVTASMSIEGMGVSAIPTRKKVQAFLRKIGG